MGLLAFVHSDSSFFSFSIPIMKQLLRVMVVKVYVLTEPTKILSLRFLQDAIKLSREGHSVLVNALIGKTNFREGSISV